MNRELSRGLDALALDWGAQGKRAAMRVARPFAQPRAVARLGCVGGDGDRARGVHAEAAQGPGLHGQPQARRCRLCGHGLHAARNATAPDVSCFEHFINRELSRGLERRGTRRGLSTVASCAVDARSLAHLLNRELSRGFGAWVEMAASERGVREKLRKGLSFMVNRKLALGALDV